MTFHEYLDRLIDQNHVNDLSIQLALIDIDNFKKVNDTYGHRAGDSVLKHVADIIKESIEADDFAARYGGEEFAVIFTEKSTSTAYSIAEDIRKKIAAMKNKEAGDTIVTVSIGLNNYNKTGKEILFKEADSALYEAK